MGRACAGSVGLRCQINDRASADHPVRQINCAIICTVNFFAAQPLIHSQPTTKCAPLALSSGECQGTSFIQGKVIIMAFRPLHDRVVVRRIEADQKTAGGIIIPDSAQEKPSEGEIVAVGEGARDEDGDRIPMDVKAGDRVLFGKWSGTEVKIDGEDLLIMKESDIMGIIG
jgi:chaperonin GroES